MQRFVMPSIFRMGKQISGKSYNNKSFISNSILIEFNISILAFSLAPIKTTKRLYPYTKAHIAAHSVSVDFPLALGIANENKPPYMIADCILSNVRIWSAENLSGKRSLKYVKQNLSKDFLQSVFLRLLTTAGNSFAISLANRFSSFSLAVFC